MQFGKYFLAITILFFFHSCLETASTYTKAAPGIWRGYLQIEAPEIPKKDTRNKETVFNMHEQTMAGELPFNFEITYETADKITATFINGVERIVCKDITYGRDKTTARDTINFYFPEYQSFIHAEIRGGMMKGEFVVTSKDNYRIPFFAHASKDYRFTNLREKPTADLSGEWATLFDIETDKPEKAIGEFKQTGNYITGTFRTETGDYRFLEGTVQDNKFFMSCFDGAHAFLFTGKINGDTLNGEFRSGTHHRALFQCWRDPSFKLGDAYQLTKVKTASSSLAFNFRDPEGKEIRFPSEKYLGKISIFTISGTWCPNCRDEQVFLADFLKKNPETAKNVVVNSFFFERKTDPKTANEHLKKYKTTLDLPFDIIFAGKANKDSAAAVFPVLDKVMAFPTMLILDKKGNIRKIHTGFDGPASSKHGIFKDEFAGLIETLLKE